MNFAEIIYQSALFTATFFIFNKLFNRFIFKNRTDVTLSLSRIAGMFLVFTVYAAIVGYMMEKYAAPVKSAEQQTLVSGQSVTVPAAVDNNPVPLNSNFEFKADVDHKEDLTTIKTDLAEYTFSSRAATLQSVMLLWQDGAHRIELLPKDHQNFAVALDQVSPIAYKLVGHNVLSDGKIHEVVYQAAYQRGTIEKKFVLYQDTYRIDLQVALHDISSTEHVRLLMPTPKLQEGLVACVNASASKQGKVVDVALDNSEVLQRFWFEPKLFGFTTKFFTTLCFNASSQASGRVYLKQTTDNLYQAIFESKPCQGDSVLSWSFYFGPKTTKELFAVSADLINVVQYGILSPLAKPLAQLLVYVKEKTGNYGIAIIIVALLLKLLLLPMTLGSDRTIRQQAEFEKKRAYLQQKFKHDKAALDQATAELIQKHGLPIFSSCLPMLLNIPVFIALNKVLTSAPELYTASFLWLPDLSAADPFYIISILVFVGMAFSPTLQKGPRQMFSRIGLALFLAAATSCLASGLALFIAFNTLFGVVQSWAIRNIRWLSIRYS